jgi:alpha-ribazole phosphatase/probable phosphoglycerate mutase
MATTLYLIRHGETEGAEERRYKGSLDVPLSADGKRRMAAVGMRLANVRFDAIYASPLSRALKSAELVAAPQGIAPTVVEPLRERNFGRWEGLTFDECRAGFPDEFNAWFQKPLTSSPVGGESTLDVRARVVPALTEILRRHNGGGNIAVVAHGGVNRIILCELLGMPLENIFRVEQNFGAVNIIELWDEVPVVNLLNGIAENAL